MARSTADEVNATGLELDTPVSRLEGFYEAQIKALMPALMAQAGTITDHSPEAQAAFYKLLEATGGMPSYAVYVSPADRQAERNRKRDEFDSIPELANAVRL